MSEDEADFHSSKLGTQQYWDETYTRELKAFHDIGDVGEIWFGGEAQDRMVRWVAEKSGLPPTSRLLDLGCGNGMMLLALREEGFSNLTGIDYSEGAIQLSRDISQKEGIDDDNIAFKVCDMLSAESIKDLSKGGYFDMCLDKGTYDAISLKEASSTEDRRTYSDHVRSLLVEDGLLVITSCNWTRPQLETTFQNDFEFLHEIPAPKFTFGGKTGQAVTTLVLKKRKTRS